MKLGIVCVHYHAADLAVEALRAIRADAASAGLDAEPLVVDNGSTDSEHELLLSTGVRVLRSERNAGYAGGIHRGARELLPGVDALVVMNPDVWVRPGCLAALVDELRAGAAVAGPRFFWDAPGGYQLPPTDPVGRWAEWQRALAVARGGFWERRARVAWRRHARRHWQHDDAVSSHDLSGALLAITAEAWRRVGPFDEGYRLYFEETDWLQRCRRAGLPARWVGRAHAVHLYAQSTPHEPAAQRWFAESEERFRRRHYGAAFVALLRRTARMRVERTDPAPSPLDPARPWPTDPDTRWIELSPSATGFPAAAREVPGPVLSEPPISSDLWSRMAPGTYFLRAVAADGRELDGGSVLKEMVVKEAKTREG